MERINYNELYHNFHQRIMKYDPECKEYSKQFPNKIRFIKGLKVFTVVFICVTYTFIY